MDSSSKTALFRLAPLVAATAAHSCTLTHTLALTTFLSLKRPADHASSIREWTRPYLYRLGPLILPAHNISAICLGFNVWPSLKMNQGLDAGSRQLYLVALTLEIVSMSMVWLKWSAVKAATEGTDDKETLNGVRQIRKINLGRLILIDMTGWACIFWAAVRVFGNALCCIGYS